MARISLPPGFRFHPTDVELVMYYLKRKIMGKKFEFDAIAELNIYDFSPCDLPDMSCLKSKDLEWFFFCPREKKYASGVRVKRATENGYWKTTGKDRLVFYKNENVGAVKTLIFHLGRAPKGERTDWVIHEYRIHDSHLAATGFQEAFVLCKVFKKSGLGPKNGAQYGAPFDEADWADDAFENGKDDVQYVPSSNGVATISASLEKQSSTVTGMVDLENTSGLYLAAVNPSTSSGPTDEEILNDSMDEMVHLLSVFEDDHALPSDLNGNREDARTDVKGKDIVPPCFGGKDIYDHAYDMEHWDAANDFNFGSEMLTDDNTSNDLIPLDSIPYLELDDLSDPLNGSDGMSDTLESSFDYLLGPCSHENMAESGFSGLPPHVPFVNQLPVLPADASNLEGVGSNSFPNPDNQFYQGFAATFGLNHDCGQPVTQDGVGGASGGSCP